MVWKEPTLLEVTRYRTERDHMLERARSKEAEMNKRKSSWQKHGFDTIWIKRTTKDVLREELQAEAQRKGISKLTWDDFLLNLIRNSSTATAATTVQEEKEDGRDDGRKRKARYRPSGTERQE